MFFKQKRHERRGAKIVKALREGRTPPRSKGLSRAAKKVLKKK